MEQQILSKKERRQLHREEKQRELENMQRGKTRKNFFTWAIVLAAIGGVTFGVFKYFSSPSPDNVSANVLSSCVNHGGISMHIHPHLTIIKNGEEQEIPANIGVSVACMRPIHTHDSSGKLHIEFPRQHDFTLRDFFEIWDKAFSSAEDLSMTVNGVSNSELENLIFRDGDQIVISYSEPQ